MKISYDPEADAIYIRLIEKKHECRIVRLNEEIALNIGTDKKLVGIEILDATEVFPVVSLTGPRHPEKPRFVRRFSLIMLL